MDVFSSGTGKLRGSAIQTGHADLKPQRRGWQMWKLECGMSNCAAMVRCRLLPAAIAFVALLGPALRGDDPSEPGAATTPESTARKQQREENLRLMHERAANCK